VEHDGKRILFDTRIDTAIFEHNVKAPGVDLMKLDFVVIWRRHANPTTGLRYVLKVNPSATLYVPADGANGFGGVPIPGSGKRGRSVGQANRRLPILRLPWLIKIELDAVRFVVKSSSHENAK
jgi:metal-dependent hydrolase (beta-lactamase superfamily II)